MGHTGIARECFAQRGNRTRSPHFKRELSGGSMSQNRIRFLAFSLYLLGVRRINLQAYDLWKATAAKHRKIWLQDHTVDFPGYVRVQSGKLEKGSIKRSAGNGKKSLGQEREFCPAEIKKRTLQILQRPLKLRNGSSSNKFKIRSAGQRQQVLCRLRCSRILRSS